MAHPSPAVVGLDRPPARLASPDHTVPAEVNRTGRQLPTRLVVSLQLRSRNRPPRNRDQRGVLLRLAAYDLTCLGAGSARCGSTVRAALRDGEGSGWSSLAPAPERPTPSRRGSSALAAAWR